MRPLPPLPSRSALLFLLVAFLVGGQAFAEAPPPPTDHERTVVQLRRIRPAALSMWGVSAALGASVLGCGLGALGASNDFSSRAYVGAMPPPDLVAQGDRVFRIAITTDVLGIFAISAAVGAIVLTVVGYGPRAKAALIEF